MDQLLDASEAPFADQEMVRQFEESSNNSNDECCTKHDFALDLNHGPRSPWNRSAAVVFERDFIAKYPVSPADMDEVKERFFTRVKTIKQLSKSDSIEREKKKIRKNRKYTVSSTSPQRRPVLTIISRRHTFAVWKQLLIIPR